MWPMATDVVSIPVDGTELRGWLTMPDSEGPHPVVVISHGYSMTHAIFYWRTASLADHDIAVLDFDQRRLGGSSGSPRQRVDIQDQIDDLRAAVAYARGLSAADPDRVAVLGSSLGAGIAIEVAATDARLAALVLIVPHVDGMTNNPSASNSQRAWLVAQMLRDRFGRLAGRSPRTIPVFGPPGTRALITVDDGFGWIAEEAEPGGRWDGSVGGVYVTDESGYRNEITALEVFQTLRFRPGPKLSDVSAPTLMMIGNRDTVTPPGPQRRVASRVPNVRLEERDWNHFSAFRASDSLSDATRDQVAFLAEMLGVTK